jgi:hypothetical protein
MQMHPFYIHATQMINLQICVTGDIDLQSVCKFGVPIHLEHEAGDSFISIEFAIPSYAWICIIWETEHYYFLDIQILKVSNLCMKHFI